MELGGGPSSTPPIAEDDGAASTVLKLKGLPYSATEQNIREFFDVFDVSWRGT